VDRKVKGLDQQGERKGHGADHRQAGLEQRTSDKSPVKYNNRIKSDSGMK
jgi:hypothetical protein